MTPDLVRRLARGRAFDVRHGVVGGGRTDILGRVHVSSPHPGAVLRLGRSVRFYAGVGIYLDSPCSVVDIGHGTYLNRRTEITCQTSVTIGQNCAIAWDVLITDTDYHSIDEHPHTAPVVLGNHVWVGARATILKGVSIGNGAVVAAGALVVRDVPAHTLVGGSPSRVLRENVSWHL